MRQEHWFRLQEDDDEGDFDDEDYDEDSDFDEDGE